MEKIAIVGMGKMGSAIHSRLQQDYEVIGVGKHDCLDVLKSADAVILAVKPKTFVEDIQSQLWLYVGRNQPVISVMAGLDTSYLRQTIGSERIVRTMPNLAVASGNSLTAWYTESKTIDRQALQTLLGKWGVTMQLEQEDQFNAFTALAGSGPAYFFELARCMEQAARGYGFDGEQARLIATQTFLGAASLVTTETSFAQQVANVASKGGTTEAALDVLAERDFEQTLHAAIDAASRRSQELGANLSGIGES